MSGQANVLMYFMQAGLVVKSVMVLLAAASITSWTLIFQIS
jgi:biopolymer transport protein TolQ